MKTPTSLHPVLMLACLASMMMLSSCVSPIQKRIEHNPQIYSALTEGDKALVHRGGIREGMTKEAVFLSWGRPDRVGAGKQNGRSMERWTYIGERPVYYNSFGLGCMRGWGGGYCGPWDPYWMGGPDIGYVPYTAATVDFRNNRVTGYMTNP